MTDEPRIAPGDGEVKPQVPPSSLPIVSTRSIVILRRLRVDRREHYWVTDIGGDRPVTVDTNTLHSPRRYAHEAMVQGHVITEPVRDGPWMSTLDGAALPLREGTLQEEHVELGHLTFSGCSVVDRLLHGGHELLTVRVGDLEVRVDRPQFQGYGKFLTQVRRQHQVAARWGMRSSEWFSYTQDVLP